MTAPAEDPRGDVQRQLDTVLTIFRCPICGARNSAARSDVEAGFARCAEHGVYRPAAGRGDTDSGGEAEYAGHVGSCRMFYAERRCTCLGSAARPAGDRAQPKQELREAAAERRALAASQIECDIAEVLHQHVVWADALDFAAQLLTLPALAALLDAQAAVNRVEALERTWRRRAVFHAEHGARETAVGLTHRANDLSRALGGTT